MKRDLRGQCWQCPYWDTFSKYCNYYKLELLHPYYWACNNPERIIKECEETHSSQDGKRDSPRLVKLPTTLRSLLVG